MTEPRKNKESDDHLTGTQVLVDACPRILVVDRDPAIRSLLHEILIPKGYAVDVCESSGRALEKLIDHKYNVLLLDVDLPGISGQELLKYCKKNHPFIEIIMLTSHPDLEDAVSTVKSGAFDYLKKPFSIEHILEKVKAAIVQQKKELEKNHVNFFRSGAAAETQEYFNIPEYNFVRVLGSGNMGVVILVEKDRKKFAMKILRREDEDKTFVAGVKRFLREAKILTNIEHPNIVKIFDYGFQKDREIPYIVMEYVSGSGLIQLIKENKLSIEQKLYIIAQIASALNTVHQYGILHRDIKPSNVIVQEGYIAKLTDFGVARIADSSLTLVNEVLGSPAYMSPENFDRKRELDFRSDIFSLGVMSYELLTGEKPFKGETVTDILTAIQKKRPIEPRKIRADIPDDVQIMLGRMLQKNKKDRFQSAAEIVQLINNLGKNREAPDDTMTQKLLKSMFTTGRVWE